MEIVKIENIIDFIIEIQNQKVIVDQDVARIYGVETKRVNEAVKNNPNRFPDDYIILLNNDEKSELVENFDRFNKLKHSTVYPKAFTEKGLYMLATILNSEKAIKTTIAIIESFAKLRDLTRTMQKLTQTKDQDIRKSLMDRSGEMMAEILYDDLTTTESETTLELNFAVLKLKHTIIKKK